jgi:hypothetical protein
MQLAGGQLTTPASSPGEHGAAGELLPAWRGQLAPGLMVSGQSVQPAEPPSCRGVASPSARAEAGGRHSPSPSSMLHDRPGQGGAGSPARADDQPHSSAAGVPLGSAAGAQAAWPPLMGEAPPAASAGAAAASDCAGHQGPPQMMRVSIKLQSAGPKDLGGQGLRRDLQEAFGGHENVPHLEASVRPGCVHLIVDALSLEVRGPASLQSQLLCIDVLCEGMMDVKITKQIEIRTQYLSATYRSRAACCSFLSD